MAIESSFLKTFAGETSIHGFRFVFGANRRWITRIFWTIAIICSVTLFGLSLTNSYRKWLIHPDISTTIKRDYIGKIPFPAITVCTPLFAKNIKINDLDSVLSAEMQNFAKTSLEACGLENFWQYEYLRRQNNISTVTIFNYTFMTVDEALFHCQMRDILYRDCSEIFNRVLIGRGFCYSINMQGFNAIFDTAISEDFSSFKKKMVRKSFDKNSPLFNTFFGYDQDEDIKWTIDEGYSSTHTSFEVPMTAKVDRFDLTINFKIRLNRFGVDNLCPKSKEFSYYIHLPNEIITPFHQSFKLDFGYTRTTLISAKWTKTSNDLRLIDPEIRNCFFADERKLKFFKSYVKAHCDFECMSNYTLKKCGCVKFSMPRNSTTKVCRRQEKVHCYDEIMTNWPNNDEYKEILGEPCDCLKNCNEISYFTTDEDESNKYYKNKQVATFLFKSENHAIEVYESIMTYKLQNFIVDVGGLLGLFLGCSVLSIIELFYLLVTFIAKCLLRLRQIEDIDQNSRTNADIEQGFEELKGVLSCHQALLNRLNGQQNNQMLKIAQEIQAMKNSLESMPCKCQTRDSQLKNYDDELENSGNSEIWTIFD